MHKIGTEGVSYLLLPLKVYNLLFDAISHDKLPHAYDACLLANTMNATDALVFDSLIPPRIDNEDTCSAKSKIMKCKREAQCELLSRETLA
jgi:hypothetical protein